MSMVATTFPTVIGVRSYKESQLLLGVSLSRNPQAPLDRPWENLQQVQSRLHARCWDDTR